MKWNTCDWAEYDERGASHSFASRKVDKILTSLRLVRLPQSANLQIGPK